MNKKVLFVVAQEGFQEWECGAPKRILELSGVKSEVASLDSGAAIGAEGLIVRAEHRAKDVNVEDFDAVIFIGGGGMVPLVGEKDFIDLAKKFFDAGKIVAAICIAPRILANAGLLKNKKATVCDGSEKFLEKAGAKYTGKDVEIDGKIITAKNPLAAEEFGKIILDNI
jgi:protease I